MARNRPSSIDRLQPDLRALIVGRRDAGATITEIQAALAAAGARVGRSALGRFCQRLPGLADRSSLGRELAALRAELFLLRGAVAALTNTLSPPDRAIDNFNPRPAVSLGPPRGASSHPP